MKSFVFVVVLSVATTVHAAVVTVASTGSFSSTSGRKCVAYAGKIHCVYQVGDRSAIRLPRMERRGLPARPSEPGPCRRSL